MTTTPSIHATFAATLLALGMLALGLMACGTSEEPGDHPDGGGAPAATEFGSTCTQNQQCDSQVCVFRTGEGGSGFCSKACDTLDDCGSNWDCDFIDGATRKFCIPEDHLAECEKWCRQYEANGCLAGGSLSTCIQACEPASVQERKSFVACARIAAPLCEYSCLDDLAPGGGPWGDGGGF